MSTELTEFESLSMEPESLEWASEFVRECLLKIDLLFGNTKTAVLDFGEKSFRDMIKTLNVKFSVHEFQLEAFFPYSVIVEG